MAANTSMNKLEWNNLFNTSTDWRRIEVPFGIISREPSMYLFIAIFVLLFSIPLNCFLMVQILRWVYVIFFSYFKNITNFEMFRWTISDVCELIYKFLESTTEELLSIV